MTKLCQFNTPLWVAEALIERHFPRLDAADLVLEPSCGPGGFLKGLPAHVPAIGIEVDPVVAEIARAETGRQIITGDFLHTDITFQPTAIIGNPPFLAKLIDGFLARSHALLPEGGRAGFILPAYLFQTAGRVSRYGENWSIALELLPRNAFHSRMRTPLMFAVFSKDIRRVLIGFALYRETDDVSKLDPAYRALFEMTTGSIWRAVCELALRRIGGSGHLRDVYAELERNRPTKTQFWREKIRQTLRIYSDTFYPIPTARYGLVAPI